MKPSSFLLVLPCLLAVALGTSARGDAGENKTFMPSPPPGLSEEQRQALENFTPVFQLIAEVRTLDRLTSRGKVSLSASERSTLLPVLRELASLEDLPPTAARLYSQQVRSSLNSTTVEAVEKAWLALKDENSKVGHPDAPFADQSAQATDENGPPFKPAQLPAEFSGEAPPRPGMLQAMEEGAPYNPFGEQDWLAGSAIRRLIQRLEG